MANKTEVLLIDSDKLVVDSLSSLFRSIGYVPFGVYTGQKGLELALNDVFELILLDVSLPDMNALELVKRIKGLRVSAPIIALAASEHQEQAIEISRNGAVNILTKPLNNDLVIQAATNAIKQLHLERDIAKLRRSLSEQHKIIGHSEAIEQFREKLKRIAASSSRVLLFGESGTGKKNAAKFIHFNSSRATGVFLAVNCAAAKSNKADDIHRLECDIFGYEKGAFVTALRTTKGMLELADGGTLYLDEVGALPFDIQGKLLRAIESSSVTRISSSQPIKIDVRILAGSTSDLENAVKAGKFREDLYFRLNVIPAAVPPLRTYKSDIIYLARRVLDDMGFLHKRIDQEALDFMKSLAWPGNLRQLKETIKLAAGSSSGDNITLDDVKSALQGVEAITVRTADTSKVSDTERPSSFYNTQLSYRDHVIDFEKRLLIEVLKLSNSNITQAAEMLKTDRGNLSKKIKKLGIKDIAQ